MVEQPKTREQLPIEYTWDLTPLYKNDLDWEKDFQTVGSEKDKILTLKGKIGESAEILKQVLELDDNLSRLLEKLHTYAHLRSDEDKTNTFYQGMLDRITGIYHQCHAELAWVNPEIMAIEDSHMEELLKAPSLKFYNFSLKQLLRYKPHTLSDSEEQLIAMTGEVMGLPNKAYSMINNADIRFPEVTDDEGNKVELTHGLYNKLLQSYNRDTRKEAFEGMYSAFQGLINTISTLLDGGVKSKIFYAKAKKYPSAIEASLFNDIVQLEVYNSLIDAVNKRLPIFHKYIALRKKMLKIDTVDMYDMYVPLIEDFTMDIPWEQACEWVKESVKPLGEEYYNIVKQAFSERWIDVLECRGKRSGAYSSGCYDSFPYILMNYNNTLNSVFTLAHELGHSMHSYLSNTSQQYRYADYPIILAEVASTNNELLLLDYLLKNSNDVQMKKYLLNYYLDNVKGTLFRQVQFAEFERDIYYKAEKGIPLTVDELNNSYYELNARYYGPDVHAHDYIKLEWSRIPHFYYNFYVYKYATGFSAATLFSENILSGDKKKREAYLEFLKSGSSEEPLKILQKAGVDLCKPDPVDAALRKFEEVLEELESLIKNS